MQYSRHMAIFFEKVTTEKTFLPSHLCLYVVLVQCWAENGFKNPVSVSGSELMRMSGIKSKVTYYSSIKALEKKGYVKYKPSFHPIKGSEVEILTICETLT